VRKSQKWPGDGGTNVNLLGPANLRVIGRLPFKKLNDAVWGKWRPKGVSEHEAKSPTESKRDHRPTAIVLHNVLSGRRLGLLRGHKMDEAEQTSEERGPPRKRTDGIGELRRGP